MLEANLRIIIQTRINFVKLMDELSIQEINKIPKGFSNNIIWNFGHNIVVQQLLCYKLSGLPLLVDVNFIDLFKKGTKPGKPVTEVQYLTIKELSKNLISQFIDDLKMRKFQQYKDYTTSYDVTLTNITEAVHFNGIHEALHLGYAMALRKAL